MYEPILLKTLKKAFLNTQISARGTIFVRRTIILVAAHHHCYGTSIFSKASY